MRRFHTFSALVLAAILSVSLTTTADETVQGQIAYSSGDFKTHEIMVMSEDGSNKTRLTQLGMSAYHPVWSPDGTRIVFVVYPKFSPKSGEICVMNSDGSHFAWLTQDNTFDSDPSWSPDGARIIFISERENHRGEIYVMNADGSNVVRLTKNGIRESGPRWSPDGSRIVFASPVPNGSSPGICLMDPDGSNFRRLAATSPEGTRPVWAPDGSRIAYEAPYGIREYGNPLSYYRGGIAIINADGTEQRRMHGTLPGDSEPSWSPDGQRIVFRRYDKRFGTGTGLFIGNTNGNLDLVKIPGSDAGDLDPDWYWGR